MTVPGAEKWTAAERETYLEELNKLERERKVVGAERMRIDNVRRKMIEKINDIEELENSINREKRTIVCGLLERREALVQEFTTVDHAQKHIAELGREVRLLESPSFRACRPADARRSSSSAASTKKDTTSAYGNRA